MKMDIVAIKRAGVTSMAVVILLLAVCASAPVPTDKLAVAHDSVQRAERSGAPELAPAQLATAKDKLNRAENAAAQHGSVPATQHADQATVDAQLAEAMANQQKSHKEASDFDPSMQALRQEAMRSTQLVVPVVPALPTPSFFLRETV